MFKALIAIAICGLIVYLYRLRLSAKECKGIPGYESSNEQTASTEKTAVNTKPEISLPFTKERHSSDIKTSRWRGFRTDIAGVKHHDDLKIISSLKARNLISLVRERDNQFDEYAVRVMYKEYFLGYVPTEQVRRVAQSIDDGETISAEISRVYLSPDHDREHGPFVQIAIFIKRHPQSNYIQ